MFSVWTISMLLMTSVAPEPVAEAGDNRARAEILFKQGVAALEALRFDDAIDHYTRAYLLLPTVTVLSNLALAHDLANHKSAALATYYQLEQEAEHAPEHDLIKLRNNLVEARKRIPILEAELAAEAAALKKLSPALVQLAQPLAPPRLSVAAPLPIVPPASRPTTADQQLPSPTAPLLPAGGPISGVTADAGTSGKTRWWPVAVGGVAAAVAGTAIALWIGGHDCRGDLKCF